jgi:hypothetical protein
MRGQRSEFDIAMTEVAIPFANLQESGFDELGGASPSAFNVIVDGKGVVSKRPGINSGGLTSSVVEAGGLTGIYVANDGTVIAVGSSPGERIIYRVNANGSAVLGAGVSPDGLRNASVPVFAETEMLIVISGGGETQKIVKSTLTPGRLGGSPPLSTHVVALTNRLLANDIQNDLTKVRFSDVALGTTDYSGHEVWSLGGVGTSGYFTAEARPDNVVALAENTGEVYVFGAGTLQTFGPDEQTTFAPISSLELGCGAPYSIIKDDKDFHWLDQKRRLVKSDGRGYTVESDGIQRTLDGMEDCSDAYGFTVQDGFLSATGWRFPTDGRTFVYQKDIGWGQWAGYASGNWAPLPVASVAISPIDGTPFVATTTGRVGAFSLDALDDFGDPIVARVTTGYLNRGTSSQKQCRNVKLALRRGDSGQTPGPQGVLRWRDRPGVWEGQIPIHLGSSGDREIVLVYRGLGVYRYRQWQFEFSGTGQVSLVSATEEFDVLGV